MGKPKIDILNLQLFSYSSRDREQATLVCNYLRYMGYNVVERSSWKGFINIRKYKPRILYLANISGAKNYIKLADYCQKAGIKVLSGDTEGNVKEDSVTKSFWGHYKELELIEDCHMLWSERIKNILIRAYPSISHKLKVAGASGFDTYRISKFESQTEFLEKYNKKEFKKAIGFGCWDFGPFFKEDSRHPIIIKKYDETIIKRFLDDRESCKHILKEAIEASPDILFVLKEHPLRQLGYKASGIEGCENFDNVLILKDEPIVNCLSACDFWVSYESTTALEAWLLNKPTCLINPSGIDFPRANVHYGSPNYASSSEFKEAIKTFYTQQSLPMFEALKPTREGIIKDIIQWNDGLNHVRIGNEIIKLLKQAEKDSLDIKFKPFLYFKSRLIEHLAPYFKTKFKHVNVMQSKFSNTEVKLFADKRMKAQVNYYKQQNLSKEQLEQIRAI